jgi:hypothetical protein
VLAMPDNRSVRGVGKVYNDDKFLAEVYYSLLILESSASQVWKITGNFCYLDPEQSLDTDQWLLLHLEDGHVFEFTVNVTDPFSNECYITGFEATQQPLAE